MMISVPCIGTLRSMRAAGQPLFADRLRATLRGEAQLDTPGARGAKALRQLASGGLHGCQRYVPPVPSHSLELVVRQIRLDYVLVFGLD
jgi:hypothetical protein